MEKNELVLIVNVSSRWTEVRRGGAAVEDVVLGDWNLAARGIDAARVAFVLASYQKRVVAAFAVSHPQTLTGYPEPRIRFTMASRIRRLEGLPSPYVWQRGERFPVVAMTRDDLPPALDPDATRDERADVAGYTLIVHTDGNATVLSPVGRTVAVRSVHRGADAKTSVTVDLASLSAQQPGYRPILID